MHADQNAVARIGLLAVAGTAQMVATPPVNIGDRKCRLYGAPQRLLQRTKDEAQSPDCPQ